MPDAHRTPVDPPRPAVTTETEIPKTKHAARPPAREEEKTAPAKQSEKE